MVIRHSSELNGVLETWGKRVVGLEIKNEWRRLLSVGSASARNVLLRMPLLQQQQCAYQLVESSARTTDTDLPAEVGDAALKFRKEYAQEILHLHATDGPHMKVLPWKLFEKAVGVEWCPDGDWSWKVRSNGATGILRAGDLRVKARVVSNSRFWEYDAEISRGKERLIGGLSIMRLLGMLPYTRVRCETVQVASAMVSEMCVFLGELRDAVAPGS